MDLDLNHYRSSVGLWPSKVMQFLHQTEDFCTKFELPAVFIICKRIRIPLRVVQNQSIREKFSTILLFDRTSNMYKYVPEKLGFIFQWNKATLGELLKFNH